MNVIISDLKIFNVLPPNIRSNIRYFHIYGKVINRKAFCVTNNDYVYSVEENLIEIDHEGNTHYNGKLELSELNGKKVEEFYTSGNGFNFARTFQNEIYSWGLNRSGRLGQGSQIDEVYPPKLIDFNGDQIVAISCGLNHCLALSSNGTLYGWGDNNQGQLIDQNEGNVICSPIPLCVNEKFKFILCYDQINTLAVTFDGRVFGSKEGQWSVDNRLTKVKKILKENMKTYVLTIDGKLKHFSDGSDEPIIDIDLKNDIVDDIIIDSSIVCKISKGVMIYKYGMRKTDFINLFEYQLFENKSTNRTIQIKDGQLIGFDFELRDKSFIKVENQLYSEDKCEKYQEKKNELCATLRDLRIFNYIRNEEINSNVKCYFESGKFYSDRYFAIFCLKSDKVYGIGYNNSGKLGLGDQRESNEFTEIPGLSGQNIEQFFEGPTSMYARNGENKIYGWGSQEHGQLCSSASSEIVVPRELVNINRLDIIQIDCGRYHCLALASNGRIYGWGNNDFGQLGDPCKILSVGPLIEISHYFEQLKNIKFIHCFENSSFAITAHGQAYYWGQFDNRNSIKIPQPLQYQAEFSRVYKNVLGCFLLDSSGLCYRFCPDWSDNIQKLEFIDPIIVEDIYIAKNENQILLQGDSILYELDGIKPVKTKCLNFYDYYLKHLQCLYKSININDFGCVTIKQIVEDFDQIMTKMKSEDQAQDQEIMIKLKPIDFDVFKYKYERLYKQEQRIHGESSSDNGVYKVYDLNRNNNILYAMKIGKVDKESFGGDIIEEINKLSKLGNEFVTKYETSWVEMKVTNHPQQNNTQRMVYFAYIQMELCDNDLRKLIDYMNNNMDQKLAKLRFIISCHLFKELLECVNHLHKLPRPIIHRDLKPGNVLISHQNKEGRFLKLCDFADAEYAVKGIYKRGIGTQYYMAPEVLNSTDCTIKSDIYSFSVIATLIFDFRNDNDERMTPYRLSNLEESEFRNLRLSWYPNIDSNIHKNLLEILEDCRSHDGNNRPDCETIISRLENEIIRKMCHDVCGEQEKKFLEQNENHFLKIFYESKKDFHTNQGEKRSLADQGEIANNEKKQKTTK